MITNVKVYYIYIPFLYTVLDCIDLILRNTNLFPGPYGLQAARLI
jgi:hypothetical protein